MKKLFAIGTMIAGALALSAADFIVQVEKFPEFEKSSKTIPAGSALGQRYVLFNEKEASLTARVFVPESGRYNVYIRDLSMNGKWRTGYICINRKKFDQKIGDSPTPDGHGQTWMWTKLPRKIDLRAGSQLEIKLISNSSRTRYDAVYFTTEDHLDLATVNMKDVQELIPEGYVPPKDEVSD